MILAISGSLRSESSSTAVLRAAWLVAPPGVEVVLYDGMAGLPAFDPAPLRAAVLRGALAALLQRAPFAVGATATRRSGGRSDSHPGPRT